MSGCLDGAVINGGSEVSEAREMSAILGERTGVIFGGVLYSIPLDRFGFDRERFVRFTLMVCLGNRGAEAPRIFRDGIFGVCLRFRSSSERMWHHVFGR